MGGCGGLVRLWDLTTSSQQAPFYGHYPALSADGKTLWCVFSSTGKLDSFNLVRGTLRVKQ